MIARTRTAQVARARSADYGEYARKWSMPMFKRAPGLLLCLMSGRGSQRRVLTLWLDTTSMRAFEASEEYARISSRLKASGILTSSEGPSYEDVEGCWIAPGAALERLSPGDRNPD